MANRAGGVGQRLDTPKDEPLAPPPRGHDRHRGDEPEAEEVPEERALRRREGRIPREGHAEERAPRARRPRNWREAEQPDDPVGARDLRRPLALLRDGGGDQGRLGQALAHPFPRVRMAGENRPAVVRERHRPVRRELGRCGEAADPPEIQRSEDDLLGPSARIRHRVRGDQLRLARNGVDLGIAGREGASADRPVEPRPVRHVHRLGHRGAARHLAARRRDPERRHVGELAEDGRVARAARRAVRHAGLGHRGERHEEAPRLAEPLLVGAHEVARHAEGGLASLLGCRSPLPDVGVDREAKGREGGQHDQGHEAGSEAAESHRHHGPRGSLLPVSRLPGTI